MSGMGISEPSGVRFRTTFPKGAEIPIIRMIGTELAFDDWDVEIDEEDDGSWTLTAQRERKATNLGKPAIIQGPPSEEYIGRRTYEAYWSATLADLPDSAGKAGSFDVPKWENLEPADKAGWIAAAKANL